MTVASTTNRVDYTGNGSTTVFSFSFRIFDNADLVVTKADADGIETTLVLDTDYTVTGAGSYSGGSITLGTALPSGYALTIQRVLEITQETDLRNQGQFFAETHEDVFDRMVMINQQLQEQIDRAAKLPITNTTDAEQLTIDITVLANKLTELTAIYNALSDIQTVADDLNEATSEIEVVAGAITNVNNVGNNITNVNTVAGISSNVTTVAGIAANVTTVAGISAAVSGVAAISAAVSAVNSNATNINAVNSNKTNIDAVAGNATNINAVNANKTNIDAVAGNETNIDAVAANATNINAVAGNETNITAVKNNATNINTVAGKATEITTVAGISSAVSAVAADATDIGTVATNIADVSSVADNISSVNSAATNMAAIIAAPTEATNASNSAIAAAASAAAAAASLDSFDDRYLGSKSSDPTLDNDGNALVTGALYYNSSTQVMKVYDGATWITATAAGTASMNVFKFVATASQTTFTGAASVGGTLSYTAGNIIVFMNGAALDAADYTASNGTSVVLGAAAAANDEVVIVAFKSFSVADTYSQTAADAKFVELAGDTMTGDLAFSGTARRIKGDFSNSTLASRTLFQNSAANSQTSIGVLPSGTATNTSMILYAGSDADNAPIGFMQQTESVMTIAASKTGSGSFTPMSIAVGGSERINIDTSGRIKMPYQPAFCARGTNSTQSGTTPVKLAFNSSVLNNGRYYSTANNRFTAPVAGNYLVSWGVLTRGVTAGARTALYKNGTKLIDSGNSSYGEAYTSSSTEIMQPVTMIVALAANDYIEVYGWTGGSGDFYLNSNGHATFSGYLIG